MYEPVNDFTTYGHDPASSMTKREHFAAMAMQGICQNNDLLEALGLHFPDLQTKPIKNVVAVHAAAYADALIEALNKEK